MNDRSRQSAATDSGVSTAIEPLGGRERPLFVDNRNGNTLERAIRGHLAALRESGRLPWELCIATAFFTLEGFRLLADDLEQVSAVRLLLGAEPEPEFALPGRKPGDPPPERLAERRVRESISGLEQGLARHRDRLPFDAATFSVIERLVRFLRRDGVDVRRYEKQFLHAKAFDFRMREGGLLVGSSNLTGAGLKHGLELNLGHYEDPLVGRVEQWFDELWGEAGPFDLAALYERLLAEFPPYLVFLRVLFELYGAELEEEAAGGEGIPLTEFQRHGVWRALKLLERHHGVLIADGVGLGKTYTAGEIMRLYAGRRQRVLLICPAQLRGSTWKPFLSEHQLFCEAVSYEELAMDRHLGGEYKKLDREIEEYALVVIDEAHNYRRPTAPKRAGVLRRLLAGQRRDLVLLTATPVNNSLLDLQHLLEYFLRQDAALASRGVPSLRGVFQEAMQQDPYDLHPDQLFSVIDATTVKRTRRFIRNHYEGDQIPAGPGGAPIPIRFPTPVACKLEYDLEEALPGIFDRIEAALMPPEGEPRLKLARYMPDEYLADGSGTKTGRALVGLIRSGLLKRFESSAYAFRRTMERMVAEHVTFLETLDRGFIAMKRVLAEIAGADDVEEVEELLASSDQVRPAAGYEVEKLRRDVAADLAVLQELQAEVAKGDARPDPKIERLVEALRSFARQAAEEATDAEDEQDKRKVLIFSFYEDTVDWVTEQLERAIEADPDLAVYRGRIAAVGGQESKHGVSRTQALEGFAPKTTGAGADQEDRYDILVSTDVLAEGMNLQQCRHIVNYDLPWNPMRLVQRHGRVDRINSRHRRVFLDTFFPDRQLDRLLELEARVLHKLAQAAASVGVESPPIPGAAAGDQSFAETREEIERLHREDPTIFEEGGTKSAAQTGEEYRQQLRKALQDPARRRQIETFPWKGGSGLAKGDRCGHVFCAKVGERVYLRFVPVVEDEEIVPEVGTCLRMIECTEDTERVLPDNLRAGAFDAWDRARRHIHEAWMVETDPANLQPTAPKLHREIDDFLRRTSPPGVDQKRLEHALDALAAPAGRYEQNHLREVFDDEALNPSEKALRVLETIETLGLEPYLPPEPLPPIDLDDVHLVCWMAVEKG